MTATATTPSIAAEREALAAKLAASATLFAAINDPAAKDVAASLEATLKRQAQGTRPVALVVVGEKKSGKSTLINGLLGRPGLSPVDADVATNVQLAFLYDPAERIHVFLSGRDEPVEISAEELPDYASENGNQHNVKGVVRVEVGVKHPLLEAGLVLFDTPGVGGLDPQHRRVTLGALRGADALLFCIRADLVVGVNELAFLEEATERTGNVIFAITKTDLFDTTWKEVAAENRATIARVSALADRPMLPLGGADKEQADIARATGKAELAGFLTERSGFTALETLVRRSLIGQAELLEMRNAVRAARSAADSVIANARVLSVPASDDEIDEQLKKAQEERAAFTTAKADWSQQLGHFFADLERGVRSELTRDLGAAGARALASIQQADSEALLALSGKTQAELTALAATIDERAMERVNQNTAELVRRLELPAWSWSPEAPALTAAMVASGSLKGGGEGRAIVNAAKRDWTKFLLGAGGTSAAAAAFLPAAIFGLATGGVGFVVGGALAGLLLAKTAPIEAMRTEAQKLLDADIYSFKTSAQNELTTRLQVAKRTAESEIGKAITAKDNALKQMVDDLAKRRADKQADRKKSQDLAAGTERQAAAARATLDELDAAIGAAFGDAAASARAASV